MNINDPQFCMVNALRQATRVLSQRMDAALSPWGIKSTQFSLLVTLKCVGPTPVSQLAGILKMERTTLTRNLKPLIAKEWVRQTTGGKDQRVRIIELSARGRDIIEAATPAWAQQQVSLATSLGQQTWEALFSDINALADS